MLILQAITTLYELAYRTSLDDFELEMLKLVNERIGFDFVALCMGGQDQSGKIHLHMMRNVAGRNQPAALVEGAGNAGDASIVAGFFKMLETPAVGRQPLRFANAPLAPVVQVEQAGDEQQFFHVLLCGKTSTEQEPARWIILMRQAGWEFGAEDSEWLQSFSDHLWRAAEINRRAGLDLRDTRLQQRASAIVCRTGAIEVADPGFVGLIRHEWPQHQKRSVPVSALERILKAQTYCGNSIEMSGREDGRFLHCHAFLSDRAHRITPAEKAVARLFAAGKSHKEIAAQLHVSPHTVRCQIANLYTKLDVHDKAALAQKLIVDPAIGIANHVA